MTTYHVTLDASVPEDDLEAIDAPTEGRAREQLLDYGWDQRRLLDWRPKFQPIELRDLSPTHHAIRLDLDCPRTPRPRCASLRLEFDMNASDGEEPFDKARRILDFPGAKPWASRIPPVPGSIGRSSFATLPPEAVIGPVPEGWLIDRHVTAYSHHLGSYGQGGIGLSGWQINGGSWLVLPLKYSESFIWLTHEQPTIADDLFSMAVAVDQRVIGVDHGQIADFPPWEHRYSDQPRVEDLPDFASLRAQISVFEATRSGFVLELFDWHDRWRFAMGDHLPRPAWGGSGRPRDLYAGESVADAFVLTHDCYLNV